MTSMTRPPKARPSRSVEVRRLLCGVGLLSLAVALTAGIIAGCSSAGSRTEKYSAASRDQVGAAAAPPAVYRPQGSSTFTQAPETSVPGSIGRAALGGGAAERKIPYDDILRYPADWPDLSALRDQTVAPERGVLQDLQSPLGVSRLVPAQSLPAPGEELWIIQKPDGQQLAKADRDDEPGAGALMAKRRPGTPPAEMVPVPLKHTDVKASVAGYIATVEVTQKFLNPYAEKIEAVYVFPLPANAAVNEFVMTVGDRHIRGIIRERQEAEQLYKEARGQGYVASLLTQERPNVFTQSVANIEPGKAIDISIRYFNTMVYSDGWYEFSFPMVVGPRFNPPGTTDGIGAVGQGSRGVSGQATEVTYLRPDKRSGHDISLAVDWDLGVPVEQVSSINHQVRTKRPTPSRAQVELDPADTVPNKDFVLRCKAAGDGVKSGLIAHKADRGSGGYFTLMLVPPDGLKNLPRKPLEFVFTLDVSGSMTGRPIEQAKAAMRYALAHMGPEDTFQVVKFASDAEQMAPRPLPATPDNARQALAYVETMQAGGGTMMLEGMRKSLDFPHDPSRLRFVSFLTDGYIGNEAEILRSMHGWLGDARVFSFGVGSSTNRYLLDHMAKMGNGAAAYLSLNEPADDVMAAYFDRISHPALTDLQIDWGGMKVTGMYPRKMPDLFVGRPVILTGRYEGTGATTVKVRGKVGNETQAFDIPVNLDAPAADSKALPAVWARMKIADLGDQSTYEGGKELAGEVKQVALEYGLMSSFTAFVAVDSLTRTAGDHGTSVPVAVPMPDGVRYDTTVADKNATPAADQDKH